MKVKNLVTAKPVASGTVIAEEGAAGDMYVLIKGKIGLYKNYKKPEKTLVQTVNAEEFFGESALFLGKNHDCTAVALENSSVLPINKVTAYKFFITEQDASRELIFKLCDRIRELMATLNAADNADIYGNAFSTVPQKSDVDVFFQETVKDYEFHIAKKTEDYMRSYPKRAAVIREGQRINDLYIVIDGHLGVYDDKRKKIADIKQGNFISPMNFSDSKACGVIGALKDTDTLVLNKDNIHTFLKYEPKPTFMVIQILCERIELLKEANKPKTVRPSTPYDGIIPENHEHGKYSLPIETNPDYLTEKYFACPICGKSTKTVITNIDHLKADRVDDDSRLHYAGIDPVLYDIVTCENCWYTALRDYWDKGMATEHYFLKTTSRFQQEPGFRYNLNKWGYNINDVFLAYYFAMFCVNECFNKGKSLILAKMWLRISWLYASCGDTEMETESLSKSHGCFMQAFSESLMDDGKHSQQLLIIAGVVCNRAGDRKNAKFFLSQAALAPGGAEKRKEQAKELLSKFGLR